jgi:hypothetical protein
MSLLLTQTPNFQELSAVSDLSHTIPPNWPVRQLTGGSYYAPNGIVAVQSWQLDPDSTLPSSQDKLMQQDGTVATMVVQGICWTCHDQVFRSAAELALLANKFALDVYVQAQDGLAFREVVQAPVTPEVVVPIPAMTRLRGSFVSERMNLHINYTCIVAGHVPQLAEETPYYLLPLEIQEAYPKEVSRFFYTRFRASYFDLLNNHLVLDFGPDNVDYDEVNENVMLDVSNALATHGWVVDWNKPEQITGHCY